jgi:hypothetical protein
MRQGDFPSVRKKKKGGASLRGGFLVLVELSLELLISFYDKEVLLGFLPLEGFPG